MDQVVDRVIEQVVTLAISLEGLQDLREVVADLHLLKTSGTAQTKWIRLTHSHTKELRIRVA